MRPTTTAACFVVILVAVGLGLHVHHPVAIWTAAGAFALLILSGAAQIGRSGVVMLAVAGVSATVAAVSFNTGWQTLLDATWSAAVFTGLVGAVAFLREAALTSVLIKRVGSDLVRQKPSLVYPYIAIGSHLISVVLNFGSISILGPVVESVKQDRLLSLSRRRMYVALLRGFAAMTMWSPFSLSYAAALTAVDGVSGRELVIAGCATAIFFLALGAGCDWLEHRTPELSGRHQQWQTNSIGSGRAMLHLAALVVAIVGFAGALSFALGASLLGGVLIAAPTSALVWVFCQARGGTAEMAPAIQSFLRTLFRRLPSYSGDVAIIGGASFIGVIVGNVLDRLAFISWLLHVPWPSIVLPIAAVWAIVLLSLAHVSPLISVTALGAAVSSPVELGVSPLVFASAMMAGWGLAIGITPVGVGIRAVARSAGAQIQQVGLSWNGPFTLIAAAAVPLWIGVLQLAVVLISD